MTKVLLVEDNTDNADVLARLLTRRGCQVRIAGTGQDALAAAHHDPSQIVLMDVGLPDIDGLEVVQRLKADPNTQDMPVIALTAHALSEDVERAKAAGCCGFAPKPVNIKDLMAAIHSAAPPAPKASAPFKEPEQ